MAFDNATVCEEYLVAVYLSLFRVDASYPGAVGERITLQTGKMFLDGFIVPPPSISWWEFPRVR